MLSAVTFIYIFEMYRSNNKHILSYENINILTIY